MVDKNRIKLLYLLILFLGLTPFLSGCKQEKITIDNWEEQVLYAQECGMDGLPCCLDKDRSCQFGQECCYDPANPDRNMCADSCDCGKEGAFCCAGEDKCDDSLACFAGYCVECGSISDPCCAGEKCGDDLVCHDDLCVMCGIPGNPCCATGVPCANQERRDNDRTECHRDVCVFCGSNGQIACQNEPTCAPGHLLNNNFCLNCGGPNQPCCVEETNSGNSCEDETLVCEKGFCTKNKKFKNII